ncbi:MAG: YggS family pyridoxal phosphate-dependent enzyme [Bacteroidota bacterium]
MIATEQFQQLTTDLQSAGARLVAVSKTKPVEMIQSLYSLGQRDFGENRVQELVEKSKTLPADINWHFIGHLQTKKVRQIAPFVQLIHAVDTEKLLLEIDKRAQQNQRQIDCLLQFHIAEETTKYGLSLAEAQSILENWKDLMATRTAEGQSKLGARIIGVMGMATYTDDQKQVRAEFERLAAIFANLKSEFFTDQPSFKELSMGMSGDYPLALEAGSTIVRVGSLLFGARR